MSAARSDPAADSSWRTRLRVGWAIARRICRVHDPAGPWRQPTEIRTRYCATALRNCCCATYQVRACRRTDRSPATAPTPPRWVGATVSELGSRVTTFAMPLVAYAMTGSALSGQGPGRGGLPARHRRDAAAGRGPRRPAPPAADHALLARRRRPPLHLPRRRRHRRPPDPPPPAGGGPADRGRRPGSVLPGGVRRHPPDRASGPTSSRPRSLSSRPAIGTVAALVGGPLGGALLGLARWAPFAAWTR